MLFVLFSFLFSFESVIQLYFCFPFPFILPSLLSCKLMASFFINCCCLHVCLHTYCILLLFYYKHNLTAKFLILWLLHPHPSLQCSLSIRWDNHFTGVSIGTGLHNSECCLIVVFCSGLPHPVMRG